MPRLYGEGPLNCLEVLRAISKTPETLEAFFAEVELAAVATRGSTPRSRMRRRSSTIRPMRNRGARRVVERLALILQGSLLVRHGDAAAADAFLARAGMPRPA